MPHPLSLYPIVNKSNVVYNYALNVVWRKNIILVKPEILRDNLSGDVSVTPEVHHNIELFVDEALK